MRNIPKKSNPQPLVFSSQKQQVEKRFSEADEIATLQAKIDECQTYIEELQKEVALRDEKINELTLQLAESNSQTETGTQAQVEKKSANLGMWVATIIIVILILNR